MLSIKADKKRRRREIDVLDQFNSPRIQYSLYSRCIAFFDWTNSRVISSVRLQGKDKTQGYKSNNEETSENFNNCINEKKETKCSNNCVGEYENVCEIEK